MRALGQMARDAGGKPIPDATATNKAGGDNRNSAASSKSKDASKANNTSGKVTRTIRGSKEVVVEIPALLGKGYPSPVDLDTGVVPMKAAPRARRRK